MELLSICLTEFETIPRPVIELLSLCLTEFETIPRSVMELLCICLTGLTDLKTTLHGAVHWLKYEKEALTAVGVAA